MADVMATGVWNRIMISDLGFSATPIGLLIALRYFLAPIGVWAGRVSDRQAIGGYHRLFWIYLGRAMMAGSVVTLGLVTTMLVRGAPATVWHWLGIGVSLLAFSLGNAFSGGTFLALIYDRSAEHQRGRAIGIVWTFLLLGFTLGGIVFGVMLPSSEGSSDFVRLARGIGFNAGWGAPPFTPATLQNLFIGAALMLAALWFFSLLGEERRVRRGERAQLSRAADRRDDAPTSMMADLRMAWQDRRTRYFLGFLGLSMAFAFSQDLILEPFAGEVLGMEARITTRFAAYWGSMAILGTIVFLFLARRFKRLTNTFLSYVGVILLIVTFVMLAVSSFAHMRPLVTPALILLGLGLGIWQVGALGLMMDMSPSGRAGTFLGFWTLVVTLARGLGVSGGGILRDVGAALAGDLGIAYGAAFIIGAIGLLASLWALGGVHVNEFKRETARTGGAAVLANALD